MCRADGAYTMIFSCTLTLDYNRRVDTSMEGLRRSRGGFIEPRSRPLQKPRVLVDVLEEGLAVGGIIDGLDQGVARERLRRRAGLHGAPLLGRGDGEHGQDVIAHERRPPREALVTVDAHEHPCDDSKVSSDGPGMPPSPDPGASARADERQGVLERLLYAVVVTIPWLAAICAGFSAYISIVYPRATLDRLGPIFGMMFAVVFATPIGIALGCSTRLRKPMGVIGLVVALLLGCVALTADMVASSH
jgi:hypothetical protein